SNADYSTPVKGPCQASATSTPAERGPSQALKCERWCQRHAIVVGVRDGLFEEPASQVHAGDEGCTWSVPVRRRSCRSVWPPTSCHGRLCSHLWQPTRSSLTAEPIEVRPTSRYSAQVAGGRTSLTDWPRNAATEISRHFILFGRLPRHPSGTETATSRAFGSADRLANRSCAQRAARGRGRAR